MVLVPLARDERADLSGWTAQGMRASATGAVDFTGLRVEPSDLIGQPGDYLLQPDFSARAWRFAAVHCGGAGAVLGALREHLRRTGRGAHPNQAARLGQAAIAAETARLWVEAAAARAEAPGAGADAVAHAGLARLAVERAALDVLELAQRYVGLQAFMRPNPIERITRDLATYLRQPAPDRPCLGGGGRLRAGRTARARPPAGLKPVPDGGEYSRCRAEKMYNSVADGRASPICPVGMRLGK
jgi:alkylation response protein AidB-like acyl-CoA dehydrogenase